MGEDQRDKFVRGGVASHPAARRPGPDDRRGQEERPDAASSSPDVATDAGEFRGMHLIDLARASLERQRRVHPRPPRRAARQARPPVPRRRRDEHHQRLRHPARDRGQQDLPGRLRGGPDHLAALVRREVGPGLPHLDLLPAGQLRRARLGHRGRRDQAQEHPGRREGHADPVHQGQHHRDHPPGHRQRRPRRLPRPGGRARPGGGLHRRGGRLRPASPSTAASGRRSPTRSRSSTRTAPTSARRAR